MVRLCVSFHGRRLWWRAIMKQEATRIGIQKKRMTRGRDESVDVGVVWLRPRPLSFNEDSHVFERAFGIKGEISPSETEPVG
jgi:hypothetical protein